MLKLWQGFPTRESELEKSFYNLFYRKVGKFSDGNFVKII